MSGFCVVVSTEGAQAPAQLRLVDLASSDVTGFWHKGPCAVGWTHPATLGDDWTIQKTPDRFRLIHGKPDRVPGADEPLAAWLPGRWGGFRGLEVGRDGVVRAFTDPWGSRPLFYRYHKGWLCIADKLPTIVLNSAGCAINWGAAFEIMALGSAYSAATTIEDAEILRPGQLVRFDPGGAVVECCHPIPADTSLSEAQIRKDPAGTFLDAMRRSISAAWPADAWMLLSGGLDSRSAVVLAGPGRKCLTVTDQVNRESQTAERIASLCGAEFQHWKRDGEQQYVHLFRNAIWLTGGLYDSFQAHHLGMASQWRKHLGISAVAHGVWFGALFKGVYLAPQIPRVLVNPLAEGALGPEIAGILQVRSQRPEETPDDVLSLLTEEGRRIALDHLRNLSAPAFSPRFSNGMETTLEDKILGWVRLQPEYAAAWTWMEELAVFSPILHPAIWNWGRLCPQQERDGGRAFIRAILSLKHPAIDQVPDANTGQPIRIPEADRLNWVRGLPGYRFLRGRVWTRKRGKHVADSVETEGSWSNVYAVARRRSGQEAIAEGLALLEGNPLFDGKSVQEMFARFLKQEDRYLEPVIAASTMGRLSRLVSGGETMFVKTCH